MAKTVLLRVPHTPRPNQKSGWFRELHHTRVVLDPYEMVLPHDAVDPTAMGIFMRLLPYVCHRQSVEDDVDVLSRYARVSRQRMKTWWPQIKAACFDATDFGVKLKELEWLSVQTISAERQTLRHLLDRLVEFWGSACVYCRNESGELQIEHIVPLARGGTDDITNLTLSCGACNIRKRTQTAAEFGHPHIHEIAKWLQ